MDSPIYLQRYTFWPYPAIIGFSLYSLPARTEASVGNCHARVRSELLADC